MANDWRPVQEPHSIESVAAVLTLAEPLTAQLLKRALRAAERTADSIGLANREQISELALDVSSRGVITTDHPQAGVRFQRRKIANNPQGQPTTVIEQDFVVTRDSIKLIETSYVRWKNFHDDVNNAFSSVLDAILVGAQVQDVRLEYRDRFVFFGEPDDARPAQLLNAKSELVAPHIFRRQGPWHLHTGMLEDGQRSEKLLTQIAIETHDGVANRDGLPKPSRSLFIMTGLQHSSIHGVVNSDQTPEEVLWHFQPLHNASKTLFRSLITDEMAERISLTTTGPTQ